MSGLWTEEPEPPTSPPKPPVVPPFTNPPSGFLYCPSPLYNWETLGGLSPCLLLSIFPATLLTLVLIATLGAWAWRVFAQAVPASSADGRGDYQQLKTEDENALETAGNGHHGVNITTTDASGRTESPQIPGEEAIVEVLPPTYPEKVEPLHFPRPAGPIRLLLTIIEYLLLTILAVSFFEMLYLMQHVFVPDASQPGPILRWTLTPVWTVVPWIIDATSWIIIYGIWISSLEEDVQVPSGESVRMVVPKYQFRWRYQGLHMFAFILGSVELYHRRQWVSRMDGIPGILVGSWRAARIQELWGGITTAAGKLGMSSLFDLKLSDAASWDAFAPQNNGTGDGLEGMGGWTAVAGEDWSFLVCFGVRYMLLATVVILGLFAVFLTRGLKPGDPDAENEDEEDELLVDAGAKAMKEVREMLAKAPQTWSEYWIRFRKVLRFAWPERWTGRVALISCFVLLVLGRIVNVNVPLVYKKVVDELSQPGTALPIRSLVLFSTLKILQGGLIDALSSLCWVPVAQHITKDVSVSLFDHLMSLSIRWHMLRKTGETIKIQNRGVTSVVDILNAVLLQVAPIFLDIILACVYFATMFDSMFALIVFSTMTVYVFASFKLTNLRVRHRKAANQLDNKVSGKAVDALVNFESVKYFANEKWEVNEYRKVFDDYQAMEWKVNVMNAIANVVQVMIIQSGMLIGAVECARRIVSFRTYSVGDFVLYLQYVNQLYGPLGQLQRQYRVLQRAMIDVETMLELFEEPPEVTDKPGAPDLDCASGQIEFDQVQFSYAPGKLPPVIKNFDAHVAPGETVALVGTSGGGKSTTLRLLYRFMDVTGGAIKVDGQDIRDVTQDSLRKAIGVVPQETVLFNNTIRYNIRYGRLDATDQEIEEAARAAQIHDRIMSFDLGYETVVGERGLRLSGGEKQRVAIARTILRNPKILFLDEATSALDNATERAIQAQLNTLSDGKTTLVIAHRLSTIVGADQIFVLDQGNIVERGSFDALMEKQGIFYGMWMAQLREPAEVDGNRGRKGSPSPGPAPSGVVPSINALRDQSSSPMPR